MTGATSGKRDKTTKTIKGVWIGNTHYLEYFSSMADAELEGKAVFAVLRPLCVQVMSSPTSQSLSSLRAGLQRLPNYILPAPLLPYVLLPLRAAIKRVARLVLVLTHFSGLVLSTLLPFMEEKSVLAS